MQVLYNYQGRITKENVEVRYISKHINKITRNRTSTTTFKVTGADTLLKQRRHDQRPDDSIVHVRQQMFIVTIATYCPAFVHVRSID